MIRICCYFDHNEKGEPNDWVRVDLPTVPRVGDRVDLTSATDWKVWAAEWGYREPPSSNVHLAGHGWWRLLDKFVVSRVQYDPGTAETVSVYLERDEEDRHAVEVQEKDEAIDELRRFCRRQREIIVAALDPMQCRVLDYGECKLMLVVRRDWDASAVGVGRCLGLFDSVVRVSRDGGDEAEDSRGRKLALGDLADQVGNAAYVSARNEVLR